MILGIDPGTKESGFCIYESFDEYVTGTIKGDARSMPRQLSLLIKASNINILAVEDFTNRKWNPRKINTSPDMGKMIGYLSALFPNIELYGAEDTKRNMQMIRSKFRNGHEYSAFCVAHHAAGVINRGAES